MTEKVKISADLEAIVPGYLVRKKAEISRLNELIAQSSLSELKTLGHGIKGSVSRFTVPEITRLGAEIESECMKPEPDKEKLKKTVAALESYLASVEVEFIQ